jgi:hypothetical protein
MNPRDRSVPEAAHAHGGRATRSVERTDRRTGLIRLGVLAGLAALLATAVFVDDERDAALGGASAPERVAALMPMSAPADARASTWYCAAGTAVEDGMADHTVTMLNPTDDSLVATVTVFAGDMVGGSDPATPHQPPTSREVDLPAGEEVALRLAEMVEAPLAAALVEVGGGDVSVGHHVSGPHGADSAPCSTLAAPEWHLAWGATTRDARDVVVLFNPFPSSATVDAVFATEEGGREPVRLQGLPVPAGSVVGVDLGDDVTRSEQISATFEARSGNVVVEHLQEYDGSLEVRGLSLTPAVSSTGETWVFADGGASGPAPVTPPPDAEVAEDEDASAEDEDEDEEPADDTDDAAAQDDEPADDEEITTERIVLYNPGDERAEVDVQVIPAADEEADDTGPAPQPFGLSLGPGRYEVLDLGAEERIPAGVPHTTVVRSTNGVGVVAERVTADRGPLPRRRSRNAEQRPRPSEISATTGSRVAAPVWRFTGLGDPDDDSSTVSFVVYNPDPDATVAVSLDLLPEEAATDDTAADDPAGDSGDDGPTRPVRVAPGARVVVELDAEHAAAATAAIVRAEGPVVAERMVRLGDGRRRAYGGGVPAADGAVPLDRLADDGLLAVPTRD